MRFLAAAFLAALLSTTGCDQRKKASPAEPYVPPPPIPRTASKVMDYASLCEAKAEPYDGAKKYARGTKPDALSKVAGFVRWEGSSTPGYEAFREKEFASFTSDKVEDIELAACLTIKKKKLARSCKYGEDGKSTLEIYDMTHDLRVVEVATGKEVLATTFDIDGIEACGFMEYFSSGTHWRGTDYTQSTMVALLPLEPDGVKLPTPSSTLALRAVCAGVPFPQTAAYDRNKKEPHPIEETFRVDATLPYDAANVPNGFYGEGEGEKDPTKIQLVACATGRPMKKGQDCPFDGGNVLELHEGEVDVAIYESRTAKLVEKKTFKAKGAGTCPFTYKFGKNPEVALGSIEPGYRRYVDGLKKP